MPHSQITLTNKRKKASGPPKPPPAAVTHRILQEDGFKLLTEAGDPLRKEQST
jgi:hypothetical protein